MIWRKLNLYPKLEKNKKGKRKGDTEETISLPKPRKNRKEEEYMINMIKEAKDEIIRLEKANKIIDKQLQNLMNVPEGCLKYQNVKGKTYYYHQFVETENEILKNSKNLYFDFSANTSDYAMQKLFESISSDRILFGTDMPISKMRMYRIEENGTYMNVVPRGLYGDVSNDPHMKESDEENITTFVYEELLAFKRAANAVGYTRDDVEKLMYKNAEKLFDCKI